jgi:hypothetical protein
MQTSQSHLKDLLDAKTNALSQADRLAAHYRSTVTRLEEEVRDRIPMSTLGIDYFSES